MDSGVQRSDGDAADLAPGTMVGEYQIEGRLGAGGMGIVYSAVHPVIAKRAAIKVLRPELSIDRSAVERFIQEARSVNQIGHDNIVDIFSFGTLPDGRAYFAMELLRGDSLRDRMAKGRLVLVDTLAILETITEALEAAHDKGIVHRDLKPDNVFLVTTKSGRRIVKLLDFGIAKLLVDDSKRMARTQTGNMLGTPAYMSPEQARGYAVDHRTDLYALGAMAFEMFTMELAFPADNAADMIAKHLFEPPRSICAIDPSLPPALDALIVGLLAKEAVDRPTLPYVRQQLQLCRESIATRTPPPGALMVTPLPGSTFTPPTGSPMYSTAPSHAAPAAIGTGMVASRPRWRIVLASTGLAGGIALAAFFAGRSDRSAVALPSQTPTEPSVLMVPVTTPAATTTTQTSPPTPATTTAPGTTTPATMITTPAATTTKVTSGSTTSRAHDTKHDAKSRDARSQSAPKETLPKIRLDQVPDRDAPM